MSRWFRHYAGMMRDDKLVRASIRSKQSIERVVWVWGAVLESASEIDDDARYEVDADEIARFLHCKPVAIGAVLNALQELGRIDGERVTAWTKRQYKSDRSNERVTAHRNKKRASGNADVTLQERCRNSPETETETETETEKKSSEDKSSDDFPKFVDPEKVMFDAGVALLTGTGTSEAKARPLIGKWKKSHGTAAVIEALGAAQRQGVIDPVGWIEGRWRSVNASRSAASEMPLV